MIKVGIDLKSTYLTQSEHDILLERLGSVVDDCVKEYLETLNISLMNKSVILERENCNE